MYMISLSINLLLRHLSCTQILVIVNSVEIIIRMMSVVRTGGLCKAGRRKADTSSWTASATRDFLGRLGLIKVSSESLHSVDQSPASPMRWPLSRTWHPFALYRTGHNCHDRTSQGTTDSGWREQLVRRKGKSLLDLTQGLRFLP